MKVALLIPFSGTYKGWVWQNSNEQNISKEYTLKEDALKNSPVGYKLLDDGWGEI